MEPTHVVYPCSPQDSPLVLAVPLSVADSVKYLMTVDVTSSPRPSNSAITRLASCGWHISHLLGIPGGSLCASSRSSFCKFLGPRRPQQSLLGQRTEKSVRRETRGSAGSGSGPGQPHQARLCLTSRRRPRFCQLHLRQTAWHSEAEREGPYSACGRSEHKSSYQIMGLPRCLLSVL